MLVIGLLLAEQVVQKKLILPLLTILFLAIVVHSLRFCFGEYASATPFAVLEVITTTACLMAVLRVWYVES